jgi:hypothetical protein
LRFGVGPHAANAHATTQIAIDLALIIAADCNPGRSQRIDFFGPTFGRC